MIFSTTVPEETEAQILGDGLPLRVSRPLTISPPALGDVSHEGPLALEYRTWGSPSIAPVRNDVSYTESTEDLSYDGKQYDHPIETVDDK